MLGPPRDRTPGTLETEQPPVTVTGGCPFASGDEDDL